MVFNDHGRQMDALRSLFNFIWKGFSFSARRFNRTNLRRRADMFAGEWRKKVFAEKHNVNLPALKWKNFYNLFYRFIAHDKLYRTFRFRVLMCSRWIIELNHQSWNRWEYVSSQHWAHALGNFRIFVPGKNLIKQVGVSLFRKRDAKRIFLCAI